MKREILFRGKRVNNGEWVYGYYVKATHHWHERGIHEDWIIVSAIQNGGRFTVNQRYAVIPETVGQYTGLTDKNGTKIFEGDIVKNDNGMKTSVEFYRGRYYPFIAFPEFRCWDEEECEVIGNIHDNKLEDFQNGC